MTRDELLANIEEDTDADLRDLAARDPEEAAAKLEYLAKEHEHLSTTAHGNARKSTDDLRREHATLAENLRWYARLLKVGVDRAWDKDNAA